MTRTVHSTARARITARAFTLFLISYNRKNGKSYKHDYYCNDQNRFPHKILLIKFNQISIFDLFRIFIGTEQEISAKDKHGNGTG